MMKPSILALMLVAPCSKAYTNVGSPFLAKKSFVSIDAQVLSEIPSTSRRSFLFSPVVGGVTAALSSMPFSASAAETDYKSVAGDIADMIKADPNLGPTLVRLAWHSSGTYDTISKTGGSGGGTIRFKEELAHGGNAGLDNTVKTVEAIKEKYGNALSYADLYTLGGVVAIKTMGGPAIEWSSGRVDAINPSTVTPDGRLPNADVGTPGVDKADGKHLRDVFYRMGFNDQEIVCLSGAHAIGRCHTTASGYDGPWTFTPTTFNNGYFTLLTSITWTKKEWSGPYQYEGANGKLMMLPTDLELIQDKSFKTHVDAYAKNNKLFLDDFAAAFKKLEELGTSGLTPTEYA